MIFSLLLATDYIILHYILERTEKGIIFTCPYITIPLLGMELSFRSYMIDKYGIPDSDDSNDDKQFINIPYSLEANEIRIDCMFIQSLMTSCHST